MSGKKANRCDWCGVEISERDGYRLLRPSRHMGAGFCRLEHVIPWLIKKNDWHIWSDMEVPPDAELHGAVSEDELGEDPWYLVRHRGDLRIADGFPSRDELMPWATAGGRYG